MEIHWRELESCLSHPHPRRRRRRTERKKQEENCFLMHSFRGGETKASCIFDWNVHFLDWSEPSQNWMRLKGESFSFFEEYLWPDNGNLTNTPATGRFSGHVNWDAPLHSSVQRISLFLAPQTPQCYLPKSRNRNVKRHSSAFLNCQLCQLLTKPFPLPTTLCHIRSTWQRRHEGAIPAATCDAFHEHCH